MIFRKKRASKPENRLLSFKKVYCEDCRFIREDDLGKKGHICLALARRKIDLREKKECQRFLKKAVERKTDVEIEKTIRDFDDVFDLQNLYKLMSGQDN